MEPVKTVEFSRLIDFNNAGHNYLRMNPEERSTLTFAINKLLKHYEKPLLRLRNEYQEEINEGAEDIRVEYCEKDEKTGIFKEKTYGEGDKLQVRKVFTGENERKANKEIKALNKSLEEKWMDKQVELTKVHIVKPIPPGIDIAFIEAFKDFIFEPMTEEQLEAHYLAQGNRPELVPPSNSTH